MPADLAGQYAQATIIKGDVNYRRLGHAPNEPICMLHVDDAEDVVATPNGGSACGRPQ
jgi:hypothetical protein